MSKKVSQAKLVSAAAVVGLVLVAGCEAAPFSALQMANQG